jgi:hypothetical protein
MLSSEIRHRSFSAVTIAASPCDPKPTPRAATARSASPRTTPTHLFFFFRQEMLTLYAASRIRESMSAPEPQATVPGAVNQPQRSSPTMQKLGLDQTDKTPAAPLCATCCCWLCGCLPCAHLMARPSALTTRSFLGSVAYFIGYSILYQLFCWAFYDSDPNTCVVPRRIDEYGQPVYATGCGIFYVLVVPYVLYVLLVIVVSYQQAAAAGRQQQQPAQQQVQQMPMQLPMHVQQVQAPIHSVDNPMSMMAMHQQQPVQHQQQV